MGRLLDIAATLLCIGAGIYLLQYHGETGPTSWFEIIGHGMGIYFIGKGLFVARSTFLATDQRDALRWVARNAQRELGYDVEGIEHGASSLTD